MNIDINLTISILSILGTLTIAFSVFFGIKYQTKQNTKDIDEVKEDLELTEEILRKEINEQKADLKELKEKREICNTSHNGKLKEISEKLNEQINEFNEVKVANKYLIDIIERVVNECFAKNFKTYNENILRIIDSNKESLQDEINKDKAINSENQKKNENAIEKLNERIDKLNK